MSRTTGLVRADGQVVSVAASTDLVVIQKYATNSGQFEPRLISVGNLLSGGSTGFTQNSVVFIDSTGTFAEDNTNFNFDDATNKLSVGSDISSTGGNLITSLAGKGLQVKEGTNARMGTTTLIAGTRTISNTSITANTRVFLSRYSANSSTALGILSVGTVVSGTSFVINALKEADATVQTNDVSIIHWVLFEPAA